ncbi:Uncharacterised protein [uncultured archaeon]|nr:Uncharacterised protein [uncultured archaeon]
MNMKIPAVFGMVVLGLSGLLFAQYTSQTDSVTFVAEVAQFIEVQVTPPSINFGTLNPLANTTSTTSVDVTNTANSNVDIKLTLSGSNFTSATDEIDITNLRMSASAAAPAAGSFIESMTNAEKACTSTVFNGGQDCSDVLIDSTVNLWFNFFVPGGKKAGTYSSTINIKSDGII